MEPFDDVGGGEKEIGSEYLNAATSCSNKKGKSVDLPFCLSKGENLEGRSYRPNKLPSDN